MADREAGDPLGSFNRGMWQFNDKADKIVVKPVATAYRTVTPRPARRGLSRIFDNLSEPFSAINALLQGQPKRAGRSLSRFVVNTTLGVGGLADHATGMGIEAAPEDFGQTLAKWGVRPGPYLVLPLLGPSSFRDAVGTGTAQLADPWRVGLREWSGLSFTERQGVMALEVTDIRSRLMDSGADSALESSMDSYATARSAWFQRREAQIANRDNSGDNNGNNNETELNQVLDTAESDAAADMAQPVAAEPGGEPAAPTPETENTDSSQGDSPAPPADQTMGEPKVSP